jgi:hypothetical protein
MGCLPLEKISNVFCLFTITAQSPMTTPFFMDFGTYFIMLLDLVICQIARLIKLSTRLIDTMVVPQVFLLSFYHILQDVYAKVNQLLPNRPVE